MAVDRHPTSSAAHDGCNPGDGEDFPRVWVASLSGESDACWAARATPFVDGAILGGIAIDDQTRKAARSLVARGRSEFLPADPIAFADRHLAALEAAPIVPGINVRTTTLEPLSALARVCRRREAILELNAHCRQAEMCEVGAGQRLLAEPAALLEQVRTVADVGPPVSVKVRAETDVQLPPLAGRLEAAGCEMIHVDAMDDEPVVEAIRNATEMSVIANNEVRGRETVFEYLSYGADAVSVGRPSDNPAILTAVSNATAEWFASDQTRQPPKRVSY